MAYQRAGSSATCFGTAGETYESLLPGPVETALWRNLEGLPPLIGVLQNHTAPVIVDDAPFLDLLQGSKAADADEVVVQAAVSYAWGSSGAVDITH
jgi:hypothetical protein